MTPTEGNICKCSSSSGQLVSSLWFPFNCNSLAIQLVTFLQFSFNCNSLTIQLVTLLQFSFNCIFLLSSRPVHLCKHRCLQGSWRTSCTHVFTTALFSVFFIWPILYHLLFLAGNLGLPTCEKWAQILPCNHMESIIFTLSPQPALLSDNTGFTHTKITHWPVDLMTRVTSI